MHACMYVGMYIYIYTVLHITKDPVCPQFTNFKELYPSVL
jgi:hypothetical protein